MDVSSQKEEYVCNDSMSKLFENEWVARHLMNILDVQVL